MLYFECEADKTMPNGEVLLKFPEKYKHLNIKITNVSTCDNVQKSNIVKKQGDL